MLKLKHFFLLAFFLVFGNDAFAAHIVGGSISYECLGMSGNGMRYRFTMKIYRDCGSGGAAFDNPANIAIYNGTEQSNTLFTNFSVPLSFITPIGINEPECIENLPSLCLQEGTYIFERVLPVSNQSYFIVYQRCCRTNAIVNINAPGDTGATYSIEITPAAQQLCNNSPVFNNLPPAVICNHYPLEVDFSAVDADGDVLTYSFCSPFRGGGNIIAGGGASGCNGVIPNPPCAPPFSEVTFIGSFSAAQPMAGNPLVSINLTNGLISGTPHLNGQYVVGVCVSEYRNGVLLSVSRREFQFNVTDCAPQTTAQVEHDELIGIKRYAIRQCDGSKTVTIVNQSAPVANIVGFEWSFDLGGGNFVQNSADFDLTIDFPDFGTYNGILVLNGGLDCGDTAFVQVELYPPASLDLGPDYLVCQAPQIVLDAGTGFASYEWQDGSSAPTFAVTETGLFFVAATDRCGNVLRDTVTVGGGIAPSIDLADGSICPGKSLQWEVPGFAAYEWSPATGLSCSDCGSVTVSPGSTTTYSLLATDDNGCTATASIQVEVLPTPMETYTIQFYPNQSVSIGGQTYTQPATVTIPVASTTGGCDSLNTYILELLPTTLTLACPANLTVALPAGAGSVPVSYAQPTASTDCPGSVPQIALTDGLPSGAAFSAGVKTVCYRAEDDCGNAATCCFTVTVTTLSLQCPPNQTVELGVGATAAVVQYASPVAATTCPDQSTSLALIQGQASGSGFPVGVTQVCYEASNNCGNTASCCFQITVQDAPPPCDVKVIGCMKFELLDIRLDAVKQPRFRIRVTNFCASEMDYVINELPPGIVAITPVENSVYTAPNTGNTYLVRNPNASPFYSLRFRSISPGLNNGAADVFEHRLPQQAFPNNYIHMFARLKNGQGFEAYLNTFYCPVQPWAGNKDAAEKGEGGDAPIAWERFTEKTGVSLHPNPSAGTVWVDMQAWAGQRVQLRLFNAQGAEVLNQPLVVDEDWLDLNLDSSFANGLYYLIVQPNGGGKATAKFLLQR